uniref:SPARC related modular calcium binding 2 n=1 Tax=Panthera tigris altaica TaxID=74533 RepID=A0A8C9JSJ2_PANTA
AFPLAFLFPVRLPGLLDPCPRFLRVDQDKDKDCQLVCAGSSQKPLCASDGRTFLSRCEFQRAKCKDPQLEIAYRGNCRGEPCLIVRSEVQCHSYTGYCWCVTPNGRPVSGTAVAHKTPRCPGSINEKLPQREGTGKTVSLQIFSVLNSDDASAPALETQPQGDEEDIASRYPTLWTEQVKSRQNKTNKNSAFGSLPKNDATCAYVCEQASVYKPTLNPLSLPFPHRYEQPKCDNTARAHPTRTRDLYKDRPLQGCPGAKKNEFLTSILDALSTDMVHAVSDPSSGRLSEPDPSHTLEERVVHWYFKLLDKNSSGDIGKKEIKPFKRFLRKKSKPKKCVKKFVEYCDVNNDKSISVPELMGCLGVTKEEGKASARKRPTPRVNAESASNKQVSIVLF